MINLTPGSLQIYIIGNEFSIFSQTEQDYLGCYFIHYLILSFIIKMINDFATISVGILSDCFLASSDHKKYLTLSHCGNIYFNKKYEFFLKT